MNRYSHPLDMFFGNKLVFYTIISLLLITHAIALWLIIILLIDGQYWYFALLMLLLIGLMVQELSEIDDLSDPHIKLSKRIRFSFGTDIRTQIKYYRVKEAKWNWFNFKYRLYIDDNIEEPNAEIVAIYWHNPKLSGFCYFRDSYYMISNHNCD